MTVQLTTQILLAERDLPAPVSMEGRFVRAAGPRWLSAKALRASARFGLRLADRLEQGYRLAA
ncbi:MAG TPA: hypothetical protein VLS51_02570 [Propionibacteriaceae bacterium]|nr:hypothetical protein [Propionibacteriaceae bacterium]